MIVGWFDLKWFEHDFGNDSSSQLFVELYYEYGTDPFPLQHNGKTKLSFTTDRGENEFEILTALCR